MTGVGRWAQAKGNVVLKVTPLNYVLHGVPMLNLTPEARQQAIASSIALNHSELVAWAGNTDGETVAEHRDNRISSSVSLPYPSKNKDEMKQLSGFFPTLEMHLGLFCPRYLSAIDKILIHAARSRWDKPTSPSTLKVCRLIDLVPFLALNPRSFAKGCERVTVVYSFDSPIARQILKRDLLFDRPIFSDCPLNLVLAPQPQADASTEGQDCFSNLAEMGGPIEKLRPDACIIGAGVYGSLWVDYSRSLGATALMQGGVARLLSGIIGNRWLNTSKYNNIIRKHWRKLSEDETSGGFQMMELVCGAYR